MNQLLQLVWAAFGAVHNFFLGLANLLCGGLWLAKILFIGTCYFVLFILFISFWLYVYGLLKQWGLWRHMRSGGPGKLAPAISAAKDGPYYVGETLVACVHQLMFSELMIQDPRIKADLLQEIDQLICLLSDLAAEDTALAQRVELLRVKARLAYMRYMVLNHYDVYSDLNKSDLRRLYLLALDRSRKMLVE